MHDDQMNRFRRFSSLSDGENDPQIEKIITLRRTTTSLEKSIHLLRHHPSSPHIGLENYLPRRKARSFYQPAAKWGQNPTDGKDTSSRSACRPAGTQAGTQSYTKPKCKNTH